MKSQHGIVRSDHTFTWPCLLCGLEARITIWLYEQMEQPLHCPSCGHVMLLPKRLGEKICTRPATS